MFRRAVAILLIHSLILANFNRFVVVASFELNVNYIVQQFCENRANPVMQCGGQCYLTKQLKQADEKEQSQGQLSFRKSLQEAFFSTACTYTPALTLIAVFDHSPSLIYSYQNSTPIFHPPQA